MALTFAGLISIPANSIDNTDISPTAAIDSAKLEYANERSGSVPRVVENRLGDTLSVKDFGATGNGVTDDRPAVQLAITAANSAPASGIYFPPGVYALSAGVQTNFISGQNCTFSGSFPSSISDGSALAGTGLWFADTLRAAGDATAGSANENTLAVQALVPVTSAAAPYQKNGIYARITTLDPATGGIDRDAVAIEGQALISSANSLGRIWGTHSYAYIQPGGDGLAYGHEAEVYNFGTDQPLQDTTTSKYNLHLVAGAGLITSAIKFGGSGTFQDFIYGPRTLIATGGNAINIPNCIVVSRNGNTTISGSLAKASGSFKIDHPLPEKESTHYLVHSFVEGPQADLIYRGKINLVSGVATVNIDTAAGMTEGTFAALCTNVQCFTTNEEGWVAVRGNVVGNMLTIEAQDPSCNHLISWMVIGERKDRHMVETDWTDDNGRVIVEPEKNV